MTTNRETDNDHNAEAGIDAIDVSALDRDEYGFPGPLRDRLVEAILDGRKTRTTSLLVEYQHDHEPLPQVGKLAVVLDSDDKAVCITRLEEVTVCNIRDITDEHARGEGEGYDDVAAWRKAHAQFWESPEFRQEIGDDTFAVDDDTEVVCERFRVIRRL
ncbi:ASCH domain-containing protein [Bifidobacterium sp. ESL0798]|uniref:ASCH domain-containing protein n=1 Tax=Bifidobacterium sp. ESL0798 TaxID=2983235 RepID=UPI0023F874CF|nr:ASCH domain-containing protein [Bifidobacterium sp. ESL0798]WEV74544.1 ASCH domain-containing protein [Bifidobacterium sp. ESL0798]